MGRGRLEAFSDGVLAIIITIMVLELKVPHEADLHALQKLAPTFGGYVLSFVYVGIYWNNHHHLIHTLKRVTGSVMWANLHLLFWLSLLPFATGWAGDHIEEALPSALYGAVLLLAGLAWTILQQTMIRAGSDHATDAGSKVKGIVSTVVYGSGIAISFYKPWMAQLAYAAVAIMWIVPDKRVEQRAASE